MSAMRTLGGSVLLAVGLVFAAQSCALFTCIEDDCESLSSGSGGRGVGGSTASATADTGTTVSNVTSTGIGGAGGAPPCTDDCPICSDPLEGDAFSLAVFQESVFVLAQPTGPTALFTLPNLPGGFGPPDPYPAEPYLPVGQLVATTESVFYLDGPTFKDVAAGKTCAFDDPIVTAGAMDTTLFVLLPDAVQSFMGCSGSAPDDDAAGATSMSVSSARVVIDGTSFASGPCWKALPLDMGVAPTCASGQKPLAVAANPSGKRILFRAANGVFSWEGDEDLPIEQVIDFGSNEEEGLPMAANTSEVFFARQNDPHHIWRCLYDPPYTCRSTGNEEVTSVLVNQETVYFTMGPRVCKWP